MKIYLVGGAVRDHVLGRDVSDRDYVVVGSTPAEMLAAGFKQVGADFPVFLHPNTGEEYALARTERKSGYGYHGFSVNSDPTVTLAEDLERRDLTVNAMAMDLDTHEIIDPHGGLKDLTAGVLRHTSDAFSDDPLRVLRVARFAAKLPGFKVAVATEQLCRAMVHAGDLGHLTQERVWVEIYKALDAQARFTRFYEVLERADAFTFVESLKPIAGASLKVVQQTLAHTSWMTLNDQKNVVLGTLLSSGSGLTEAQRRGLPIGALKVMELQAMNWRDMSAESTYERLQKSGALRGGWEFVSKALAVEDDSVVRRNNAALQAALSITAASFAHLSGKELGDELKRARIAAIKRTQW